MGTITKWTKEEDDYLREHTELTYRQLAEILGRTVWAVSTRVRRIGANRFTHWSETEETYLEENFGRLNNIYIAKKLGRTVLSVRQKATLMGLGRKDAANGMITLSMLNSALYPRSHNTEWKSNIFEKHGLHIYKLKLSTKNPQKVTKMVKIDEFWKWAECHQDIVDFCYLEEYSLGVEPKWVKEKRKQEWLERSRQRWKGKG